MSEYKKPKKVEMGARPTAQSNGGSCKLLVENTPNTQVPLCCGKEPPKKKIICG